MGLNARADHRLVTRIRTELAAAGDPERATGQQQYMKSALPFHGITTPELTKLLKPILAGHRIDDRNVWEATIRALWDHATHREQWYAALALADHKHYAEWRDPDTLALYRHLIVTGAWWDVVDVIASRHVGLILGTYRPQVTPQIRRWATDHDLWIRRTAILAQLKHKASTDTDLLADALVANLIHSPFGREFFIRKAVGWALREYAKTDPDWVEGFLDDAGEDLAPLSRREATKHLRRRKR